MYRIPTLPLKVEVETKAVLKQAAQSHRRLAELKGAVLSLACNGLLSKMKLGRDNFYLNTKLFDLLINAFHMDKPTESQQHIQTIG